MHVIFSSAFPGYPCSPSEEFFVGFWNVRNRRFNQNDHQATCNQPLEGGIVSNSGVGPHTPTTPRKPRTRFRPPQYGNGPARVSLAAAPAAVTMNAVCTGVIPGHRTWHKAGVGQNGPTVADRFVSWRLARERKGERSTHAVVLRRIGTSPIVSCCCRPL